MEPRQQLKRRRPDYAAAKIAYLVPSSWKALASRSTLLGVEDGKRKKAQDLDILKTSRANLAARLLLWLSGCLLFSLGVKFFIDSNLGTDPLHAMIIGIVNKLDIPYIKIGVIELIVVVITLIVWCAWNKQFPMLTIVSVFFTMVNVGFLVDFWNYIRLESMTSGFGNSWALCVCGLTFDAYASALIITSGIGIRNMDLLAITFVQKLGCPFIVPKVLFEIGFVTIAYLGGGPVGAATLLFVLIVGSLIQPFMALNSKVFGLMNYGMAYSTEKLS
jgi:uncharacterized membrane protein YczE